MKSESTEAILSDKIADICQDYVITAIFPLTSCRCYASAVLNDGCKLAPSIQRTHEKKFVFRDKKYSTCLIFAPRVTRDKKIRKFAPHTRAFCLGLFSTQNAEASQSHY